MRVKRFRTRQRTQWQKLPSHVIQRKSVPWPFEDAVTGQNEEELGNLKMLSTGRCDEQQPNKRKLHYCGKDASKKINDKKSEFCQLKSLVEAFQ